MQEVLDAAQTLPADERTWLIHALWDTMEPRDWPPLSEEWVAEVRRRSRQLDEGTMTCSSWAEGLGTAGATQHRSREDR